jgi:hypothetical protein
MFISICRQTQRVADTHQISCLLLLGKLLLLLQNFFLSKSWTEHGGAWSPWLRARRLQRALQRALQRTLGVLGVLCVGHLDGLVLDVAEANV